MHIPVLLDVVLDILLENNGTRYLDCTFGEGGHSIALLDRGKKDIQIYGIDRDPECIDRALEKWGNNKNIHLESLPFDELDAALDNWGVDAIDGVLFDVGLNSLQLDDPERGFSYRFDGPLDLRYDQRTTITGEDVLNEYPESDIANIIFKYGEERKSRRIAAEIVKNRPLRSTAHLIDCIRHVTPSNHFDRTLARVFQSIRVYVNDEIGQIERALPKVWEKLAIGGRLVFISYDSIPDRIVKLFIRKHITPCTCPPKLSVCVCGEVPDARMITKKPIVADKEEIEINPRSKSAKLRAVEKYR